MLAYINDLYRISIQHDGGVGGWHVLTPTNQTLEWEWSNDNDLKVWGLKLNSKLVLHNDYANNNTDFDVIKDLEQVYKCYERDIIIHLKCGDTWERLFVGVW